MKRIVVLTGAGISAESGISTFRDSNGLWENHSIEDVASTDGWARNKSLVLNFYNQRRAQLLTCQPNLAHKILAELAELFDITIITQNVDDLHERAGSTNVIHLHGELLKARSSVDENIIYDWKTDIHLGNKCEKGSQLRPHIVWFGEAVPLMDIAIKAVRQCDIFIVIGTSLMVYPAAGLVNYAPYEASKYLIDPDCKALPNLPNLTVIAEPATVGVVQLQRLLEIQ